MSFPNIVFGSEERIFDDLSSETVPVGTQMVIEDGRIFRFTEAAGAALVVANLNEGAVPSANTTTEVVATLAAGVTVLTSVGTTTANLAANILVNGYVYTDNATTLPLMRIKSNTLLLQASTPATNTITLFQPTPTAIAEGNTISYYVNPWRDVLVFATTPVSVPTGVGKVALTANQYGWLQTGGPCSVSYDSTTTAINSVGDPVGPSSNTAGSIMGSAAADTIPIIGLQYGVVEGTGEQDLIFLTIE